MKEFRKRSWYEVALYASFIPFIYSPIAYTADTIVEDQIVAAANVDLDKDTYTVNFNNISIIELIRFTSKITNLNFVFEEADLQFNVTVVSEEAVTAKSMMSALSQVLRMHDLTLLEEDGNVLITKSKTVNQIAPIVSSDLSESDATRAAIVTRVFRIKNGNVNSIANILRPMISAGALIEVSVETRQLIVTDITTNVDQIASLLTSLDAPHSPLDVETYVVKNISPPDLISLSQQILSPFTEGNPLIFVPQAYTNSIFIVSTPYLIERAMTVMEDLDIPAKASVVGQPQIKSTFLIYTPQHRSGDVLSVEITENAETLKESGLTDPAFLQTLDSMNWIATSNSLIFTGDPQSIEKVKAMLASMDISSVETAQEAAASALSKGFYIYKLQVAQCDRVLEEIKNVAAKLPSTNLQSKNLQDAISKIECIKSNNSLLISGSGNTIEQIKSLIAEFDTPSAADLAAGGQAFLIYKPKYLPAQEIQAALTDLTADLQAAGLNDPQLFQVLGTMRYVTQTDSLLFTGSQQGLDKVQNMINGIDTSAALGAIQKIGNLTFLIYKIQNALPEKLITSLKTFAVDLKQSNAEDKQLAEVINGVKWIKETNSLLFTGNSNALERVEQLVKKFDLPSLGGSPLVERAAPTFVIYNPKYLKGDDLISVLCDFMDNLMSSGVSDPGLYDSINNLKWIEKTSSLLISGEPASVEKVQQLLVKFDIPSKDAVTPSIESIDNTSFLVYKLQFHPGNDIQNALKQVASSLGKGSSTPVTLVDAINSLQWVQVTNSLLCTGQQDVLVKLKELIQNLDVPLRQVFIEVLVIETSLFNQQNFGLAWGGQVQYMNKTVVQTQNFPLPSASGSQLPQTAFPTNLQGINGVTTPNNTSVPFSNGFDLGVIGDIIMHKGKSFISLGSLVNAIQQDTDSTIILNPKIITQDNRQSTVFVGQNIPYTGALVTTNGNTQTQTANIEYRDVGVSLTITPILGDGDVITMDIVQDISELSNGGNVTTGGTSSTSVTGIQTNHTHMETRVHVPNNHFVALSGMINDSKTHFKTGIPCLGGLPVVGALFSENDRTASKSNVIIFVRPQIVNNYQEYKAITEHQEWLYKDNARLPVLKEEFDEGIDMVKLPENE
jgi:type II secretory pathway component GspD/PulD (secretin)